MAVKCLNETEKSLIVNFYFQQQSITSLAEDFGVSHKTINRVLIERNAIQRNWRSEIILTPAEAELINSIREESKHPRDMVSLTKLRMTHVFAWFRRQSLPYQKAALKLLMAEHKQQQAKAA